MKQISILNYVKADKQYVVDFYKKNAAFFKRHNIFQKKMDKMFERRRRFFQNELKAYKCQNVRTMLLKVKIRNF